MTEEKQISADEIALYDRQIRLWGVAAQTRMSLARVLLIEVGALANEIAKNLVLAGIGSLTVLDDSVVSELDLGAQFFIEQSDVGSNRAEAALPRIQKLNPRVSVKADSSGYREKTKEYYAQFDIVIATELSLDNFISINNICRELKLPFYAGGLVGLYGFIFLDLISHTYTIEREKSNITPKIGPETATRSLVSVAYSKTDSKQSMETVTKNESYKPLSESINSKALSSLRPRQQLRVSPVLPALKAMWQFEKLSGAFKSISPEELVTFTTLVQNCTRDLGLPIGILSDAFLSSYSRSIGAELSPVAAILGGILAQDVLNLLSQKEQPIQNWVIFDGDSSTAAIYCLQ
ncbi:uncharacterized protein V1516DRAFT_668090 [Lipomyces oligophaga]|uniref:uncharacterized protein n=1 Tax=Lipomyces oligophaga TaxID=45792 RepID=UPI0034CF8398